MLLPGFIIMYMGLSAYVMMVFLRGSDFGGQYGHTFTNMMDGTGERPMAYRALLPFILRGLIAIIPQGGIEVLNELTLYLRNTTVSIALIHSYRETIPPTLENLPLLHHTLLFVVLVWLCLLGYLAVLYKLARQLFPESIAPALFAPLFALLLMPALHNTFAYPYDYSLLLLNTTCFYALARHNLRLYYACFILAIINKETALYLAMFFALSHWKSMPMRTLSQHVLAQAAIWLSITFTIRISMGGGADGGLFASKMLHFNQMMGAYDFDGYLSLLVAFFFLTYRWPEKPLFLRRGFWLLLPLSLAFVLLGYPTEYRQFLDIAPITLLLATHSLVTCTGLAASPLFRPKTSPEPA